MSEEIKNITPVLSVFDFDGTLTYHDSFIPFLRFAFGNTIFLGRLIQMVIPSVKCLSRQLTRDQLKEVLIKTYLTGIDGRWLNDKADDFCTRYWGKLMRPAGIVAVATEVNSGAEVTICSASPAMVLRPFAERLGIKLIGTQLEMENGKLTGYIVGHNCRRARKVQRLESVYGPLAEYHLRAWGDSQGDYELLLAAQDAYWRHFEPAGSRGKIPDEIRQR